MKAIGVLEKGFQMAQEYGYMTREMSHFICGVFIHIGDVFIHHQYICLLYPYFQLKVVYAKVNTTLSSQ